MKIDRAQDVHGILYFRRLSYFTFLLVAAAVFYLASFASLTADDFGRAYNFNTYGLIRSIHSDYGNWSGRFVSATIEYALSYFTPGHGAYWIIVLALNATVFAFLHLSCRDILGDRRLGWFASVCVYTLLFTRSRDLAGGLFWVPALIEYMICAAMSIHVLSRSYRLIADGRRPGRLTIMRLCILGFLAAGMHELLSIAFLSCLTMLIAWRAIILHEWRWWIVLLWLVGAASLLLVAMAPGNAVRVGVTSVSHHVDASFLLRKSLRATLNSLGEFLAPASLVFLVALKCQASSPVARERWKLWHFAFIAGALFGLVTAMFLVPVLLTNYLAPRTVDAISIYVVMIEIFLVSNCLPDFRWLQRLGRNAVLGLCLLWALLFLASGNVYGMGRVVENEGRYRSALAERDRFLATLRGHKDARVVLAPLPDMAPFAHWADIRPDEGNWINLSVARYYGIGSVRIGSSNQVRFDPDGLPPSELHFYIMP
jgi:hypothetical protein